MAHVAVGADPAHLTAADVMSNDLITASPDESVLVAARRMEDAEVRHLPVLDDGRIAGIMSMRDVFTVFVDDADDSTVIVARDPGDGGRLSIASTRLTGARGGQTSSGSIVIEPVGHSSTHSPQPLAVVEVDGVRLEAVHDAGDVPARRVLDHHDVRRAPGRANG